MAKEQRKKKKKKAKKQPEWTTKDAIVFHKGEIVAVASSVPKAAELADRLAWIDEPTKENKALEADNQELRAEVEDKQESIDEARDAVLTALDKLAGTSILPRSLRPLIPSPIG